LKVNKKKIIYFIGSGRSGSTILSIALSNLKDVDYYGELSSFWSLKGIPRNADEKTNSFWQNIIEKYPELTLGFNNDFHKYFEHHYAIFYPKLYFSGKKKYLEVNKTLFNLLLGKSKSNILIDSSHYPLRALLINKLKNYYDFYFVYLYKEPIKVISSFQKKGVEQNYKNPINANLYYLFVSLLTFFVLSFIPKENKIFIQYEDFIKNPQEIIKKILKFIDLQTAETIDFNKLKVPKYIFDGNRLRQKMTIKIESPQNILLLNKFWSIFTYVFQLPVYLIYKLRKK